MKKAFWAAGILLALSAAAYFGLTWTVSRIVSAQLNTWVAANAAVQSISYDTLRVHFIDPSVRLNRVQVTLKGVNQPVVIDRATIFNLLGFLKQEHNPYHFSLTGVNVGREVAPGVFNELEALGYQDLVIDLECLAAYQKEGGEIDIGLLKIGAKGMGEVALRLKIENIDLEKLSPDSKTVSPWQVVFALPGAFVSSANLAYTDQTILKRMFSMKAEDGTTLSEQALARIERDLGKKKNGPAQTALLAIRDFIQSPDRIVLEIQPKAPVSFLQLAMVRNIPEFIDLMGLTVVR